MKKRRWNEKELSILKEHGSTMLVRELLELLPDRTVRSIRYKVRNLGITLTADTRQRMHGSVYGVGINDLVDDPNYHTMKCDHSSGKKRMVWKCPFYQKWRSMLRRCYGSDAPAYKGCTVSEGWHRFSTFKKWMESQSWEGKELDKDILVPGNKVYGEDTCLFVSKKLNNLFHIRGKGGEYPQGVHLMKSSSTSYIAECYRDGKSNYLGSFATVEEASSAYIKYKREYILEVADNLTEDDTSDVDRTRESLRAYAAQSGWTPPA